MCPKPYSPETLGTGLKHLLPQGAQAPMNYLMGLAPQIGGLAFGDLGFGFSVRMFMVCGLGGLGFGASGLSLAYGACGENSRLVEICGNWVP